MTHAKEVLDWEPRVSAKEGLDLAIKWFAKPKLIAANIRRKL
jgi:nucleoside-diphosphate-sugar epimerase